MVQLPSRSGHHCRVIVSSERQQRRLHSLSCECSLRPLQAYPIRSVCGHQSPLRVISLQSSASVALSFGHPLDDRKVLLCANSASLRQLLHRPFGVQSCICVVAAFDESWRMRTIARRVSVAEGKQVGRAGGQYVIVPGGPRMHLTATATETRRAIVLILHDSSKAATTQIHDWTPKGLCKS